PGALRLLRARAAVAKRKRRLPPVDPLPGGANAGTLPAGRSASGEGAPPSATGNRHVQPGWSAGPAHDRSAGLQRAEPPAGDQQAASGGPIPPPSGLTVRAIRPMTGIVTTLFSHENAKGRKREGEGCRNARRGGTSYQERRRGA